MTSMQDLRVEIDVMRGQVVTLRREVNSLNRLLTDAQSNQARAIRERDEARAQLAARQADTPAPRPFRVGDRVRVAEGAKAKNAFGESVGTCAAGKEGLVRVIHADGDLLIDNEGYVSPEFCTLIEPEPTPAPEPTTPAPSVRVRVVYADDALSQAFDADEIEVMEAAPVYALLKGGAVVACVPVAGVRSVEVVS